MENLIDPNHPISPPQNKPFPSKKRPRSLFEPPVSLDTMVKNFKPSSKLPRILTIKCLKEKTTFFKISSVAIAKAIQGVAGTVKSVRKLRNGLLLVETANDKQSELLLKTTKFDYLFDIEVKPHEQLNNSKGIISCSDLKFVTNDEIKDELSKQGVIDLYRIMTRVDGEEFPTGTTILTFNTKELPEKVIIGYHILDVRTYIPNPMRCFTCQRFGHTKNVCKSEPMCRNCGEKSHGETQCEQPNKCVNCSGPHASSSRDCPRWTEERKICEIMAVDKINVHEARKRYRQITPTNILPVSFAQAVATNSVKSNNNETINKPKNIIPEADVATSHVEDINMVLENTQLKETVKSLLVIQKQLQDQLKDQAKQLQEQGKLLQELIALTRLNVPSEKLGRFSQQKDVNSNVGVKVAVNLPKTPKQANTQKPPEVSVGPNNRTLKIPTPKNSTSTLSLNDDMLEDKLMDENPYTLFKTHKVKIKK